MAMKGKSGMGKGSSSPSHQAVGSGSRPGGGKIKIATSGPSNPHTLGGRNTPGALGMSGKAKQV